jgi:hypothetical protein
MGNAHIVKGIYLIVDGGFTKEWFLVDPFQIRLGIRETYWSEWLESIRKDIECFFGIVKGRFRILWNASKYFNKFTYSIIAECHR